MAVTETCTSEAQTLQGNQARIPLSLSFLSIKKGLIILPPEIVIGLQRIRGDQTVSAITIVMIMV